MKHLPSQLLVLLVKWADLFERVDLLDELHGKYQSDIVLWKMSAQTNVMNTIKTGRWESAKFWIKLLGQDLGGPTANFIKTQAADNGWMDVFKQVYELKTKERSTQPLYILMRELETNERNKLYLFR